MLNYKKSLYLQSTNSDIEPESATFQSEVSQSDWTRTAVDQDLDEASTDDFDLCPSADDFSAIAEERAVPRGAVLEFDDIGSDIEQFFAASGQRWCLQREFGSMTF